MTGRQGAGIGVGTGGAENDSTRFWGGRGPATGTGTTTKVPS
jgi:hypothetical protein